ncbi:MAG: helix-turn-helix transcriptional regulator [Gammaproteobacteria bacterium]|nr:helix-turn-helix transcriptional regulator [Gammaproteobacteria bacterium]
MSIIFRLDRVMADRKISLNELAARIGLTNSNVSILKTGKAKAVRVTTIDAICRELNCQPGDLLEYEPDTDIPDSND